MVFLRGLRKSSVEYTHGCMIQQPLIPKGGSFSQPIAVCGPIAPEVGPSRGGYETSNRRLLHLLETHQTPSNTESGLCALSYPQSLGLSRLARARAYQKGFAQLRRAIMALPVGSVFHFTPMVRHFILWELSLARLAHARGLRVVIDLRGGNKLRDYQRLGPLYRRAFGALLARAGAIGLESPRYLPFVGRLCPHTLALHMPNFLPDSQLPTAPVPRNGSQLRCIYVGAVIEAKGVLQACRAVTLLADAETERTRRNPQSGLGRQVRLDLFGRATPEMARQIAGFGPHIHLHGPKPYSEIREALRQAHVFVYLSAWRGEGQSNALTEAMGEGCVPVVTDHGFSADLAQSCGEILADGDTPELVARAIRAVAGDEQRWQVLSLKAQERVRRNYSSAAALQALSLLYAPTQMVESSV